MSKKEFDTLISEQSNFFVKEYKVSKMTKNTKVLSKNALFLLDALSKYLSVEFIPWASNHFYQVFSIYLLSKVSP